MADRDELIVLTHHHPLSRFEPGDAEPVETALRYLFSFPYFACGIPSDLHPPHVRQRMIERGQRDRAVPYIINGNGVVNAETVAFDSP